jgi:hypothetical protein
MPDMPYQEPGPTPDPYNPTPDPFVVNVPGNASDGGKGEIPKT